MAFLFPSSLCVACPGLFYYIHLIKEISGTAELVHDEEDIADVHIDAPLEVRLEHYVAAH